MNSIYPDPSAQCSQKNWVKRDSHCSSGLDDLEEIGDVAGKLITIENLESSLREHSFQKNAADFYSAEQKAREFYDTLPNPGVETVIIYGSNNRTPRKFFYNKAVKPRAESDDSGFISADKTIDTLGDGIVIATSAITPGFKWADEFNSECQDRSR